MADVSVGAAVGAGFGLIRRKPLAVLAWGAVQILALAPFMGGYASMMLTVFSQLPQGDQTSPNDVSAAMGGMMMGEGLLFLGVLVFVFVRAVVCAAIWRAVLRPGEWRWAYLRLGLTELFVLAVMLVTGLAANLIVFPLIPFLLLVGGLVAMHQWLAAAVAGALVFVALIAATVYLQLRFVLAGPMVVDHREFRFLESWTLTRGKVGSLFVVGLCLVAIVFLAEILIYALLLGLGAAALATATGGFRHMPDAMSQGPAAILPLVWPYLALLAILAIPLVGAFTAVVCAPWASAYRDLAHPPQTATPA